MTCLEIYSKTRHFLSNIVFTIPLSIIVSNIFFKIIKIIGPINIPTTPIILNPVYIEINVNIGCTPILLLTIRGSAICLVIIITIYNPTNEKASVISPLNADIMAHGKIIVPAPKIGRASTKAIISAITNGYLTFRPNILNNINPINIIENDINIKKNSAFK